MVGPTYEFHHDHLLVKLDPRASVVGIAGSFLVPYSTVASAEIVEPEIPGLFDQWLHGLHVPGRVARGRFIDWRGKRRFLWIDTRTPRALRLTLRGHPAYDELLIDVPDPESSLQRVEDARRRAGSSGLGHMKE